MKTASVADILKKSEYWGQDLSDMLPVVQEYYDLIEEKGHGRCIRCSSVQIIKTEVRDMIKEGRVQLWTCPSLTYKQSFTIGHHTA